MPSRRRLLATLGAGIGVGATGGYIVGTRPSASQSDGPPEPLAAAPAEWPFRHYDRRHSRNPPPESSPSGSLHERWRYSIGDREFAGTPVVGNGHVILPVTRYWRDEHLSLRALDMASGSDIWKWRIQTDDAGFFDIPIATVGDHVFCGAGVSKDATFALAAASGHKRWERSADVLGRGVLTAAGYLLTTTRSNPRSEVQALDARTGKPAWEWQENDATIPAFDGERIIVGTRNHLVGLDTHTGEERWRVDELEHLSWGPALANGRAFVGTGSGDLAAFDAATGDQLWRRSIATSLITDEGKEYSRYVRFGAVTENTLVAVERRSDMSPDVLHIRDPSDGTHRFEKEPATPGNAEFSAPVVVDGTIYVGESNDEGEGGVTTFDAASGERTATRRSDGVWSLLVANGKLFARTEEALIALA